MYAKAAGLSAVVISISTLVGCMDKEKKAVPVVATEPAKVEVKAYTATDWKRDFTSAFKESEKNIDKNGITKYYACFDQNSESKNCVEYYSSRRDGFKKVDYMTPIITAAFKAGDIGTMVNMYIAAIECRDAKAVLQPNFNGDNGWLFMDKIAFMAEGEVVFEKSTDPNEVDRDNEGRRVHEKWTFALEKDDESRLLKFAEANSRIIRITGKKGYATIEEAELEVFTKDIKHLIKNKNQINDSLKSGGGPNCTEIPGQQT